MRLYRVILISSFVIISSLSWFPKSTISQTLPDATKLEIQRQVESEVEQSIGAIRWSITFVLTVLGITPIFVGIFVLILKGGIIRQISSTSQSQLDEFIKTEIKSRFNIELERQKNELTQKTNELFESTKEKFKTLESKTKQEQNELLEDMTDYLKRLQAIAASNKDPKLYQEIKTKFLNIKEVERQSEKIDSYSYYMTQGIISHIAGNYDVAINFFEYAIKLEPNNSKAWTAKGDALYRLADYEQAVEAYKEATKKNPNNFEAWTYMGNPYCRLGEYQKAVEAFNEAIKINGNYPYSWYYLARCYAMQNEVDLMIKNLEKAIELNPICSDMTKKDPGFNQYRETTEFQTLFKNVGTD